MLPHGYRADMDIRAAQRLVWQNKLAKGFDTTDVRLEFCLLNGEVAEAFDAWRKGGSDVADELADIALYLFGLAEKIGIDLQDAIESKMAKNSLRTYRRLPTGVLVKEPDPNPRRDHEEQSPAPQRHWPGQERRPARESRPPFLTPRLRSARAAERTSRSGRRPGTGPPPGRHRESGLVSTTRSARHPAPRSPTQPVCHVTSRCSSAGHRG
jgi:NTP pyrophosphatase (non-canonical NTP hydrolase)